jgi:hypothetical protein
MTRVVADVPADSSILCEGCGYTLDGLPTTLNCPECGKPVAESAVDDGRLPAPFDKPGPGRTIRFFTTTAAALFWPSHFFRHTTARNATQPALEFALIHWGLTALLFGTAAWTHALWFSRMTGWRFVNGPFLLALIVLSFISLWGITRLASRLTVWEARYRGIRLPRGAVLRGLYYHAAHYLPVGLLALLTTAGYFALSRRGVLGPETGDRYLWVLSGEVIVCAMYLFWTYWAAMRNMMYANR